MKAGLSAWWESVKAEWRRMRDEEIVAAADARERRWQEWCAHHDEKRKREAEARERLGRG